MKRLNNHQSPMRAHHPPLLVLTIMTSRKRAVLRGRRVMAPMTRGAHLRRAIRYMNEVACQCSFSRGVKAIEVAHDILPKGMSDKYKRRYLMKCMFLRDALKARKQFLVACMRVIKRNSSFLEAAIARNVPCFLSVFSLATIIIRSVASWQFDLCLLCRYRVYMRSCPLNPTKAPAVTRR